MALLNIGINDNVSISKETGFDEEGNMVLVLQVKPTMEEIVKAMEENKVLEAAKSQIRLFLPNLKDFNQRVKSSTELASDVMKFRETLMDYASLVGSKEAAENAFGGIKVFQALGITEPAAIANLLSSLNQEATLNKVVKKVFEMFATYVNSIENLEDIKFRQKMWRQSAKKNFPTLPSDAGKPFIEPMEVPFSESKIKWSAWEIEKKKNDTTDVAATASEDTIEAKDMFQAPAENPVSADLLAQPGTPGGQPNLL